MKTPCLGAGQTVRLTALPSVLVTCPECGRRNLGARFARWSTEHGDDVGDVPPHTAAKPSLAQAQRAIAANARGMRSDDERYDEFMREWYDSREWDR